MNGLGIVNSEMFAIGRQGFVASYDEGRVATIPCGLPSKLNESEKHLLV